MDQMSGEVDDEIKYQVLTQWWSRHCRSFSEWFLGLSSEAQHKVLLIGVKDMPAEAAETRQSRKESVSPSDIILPELCQDGLLAANGRVLILFVTRRCVSNDLCLSQDTKFLTDICNRGRLPDFSESSVLSTLDTPFIDPNDKSETVQCLNSDATTSIETRMAVANKLASGELVHAGVWIALKLRRSAIIAFLISLVAEHQTGVTVKPSPTYRALLLGELQQRDHVEVEEQAAAAAADVSRAGTYRTDEEHC